jgi:hypothetical protein
LLGALRLSYADLRKSNVLLALLHLAVTTAELCGAGGVRAVMAAIRLILPNGISRDRLGHLAAEDLTQNARRRGRAVFIVR